ncbi:uncharacterized protein F5891DRAFT_1190175 [Suillus fuscotomentosus]|uniref:ABC transporter domain-containing protein n=1 Tax=Suillus fuscotomentosus TaxID=1912939 RepID=A0AAD4HK03_9AGAM|nr:uncharacterized protein F5891DRAFT_1190175 [Suillus fuscotomentosus]KAG1898991.1 hypothetical protein F5891DRAFT_1190175 [Suillus fuscotomentosus]
MGANGSKKAVWFATARIALKSSDRAAANRDTKSIVQISRSNIYRFGDFAAPVFRDVEWTSDEDTPRSPTHNSSALTWRTISLHATHTTVWLLYHLRIGRAQQVVPSTTTLLDTAQSEKKTVSPFENPKGGKVKTPVEIAQDEVKKGIFEDLTSRLGLSSLLDLPLIALSNGQTRRARIVKAILSEPELLVLDEPLTGLDVNTRPILLNVLRSLHESRSPRTIMGLWIQDPVSDWISHIALVTGETILTGVKDDIVSK